MSGCFQPLDFGLYKVNVIDNALLAVITDTKFSMFTIVLHGVFTEVKLDFVK